MAESDIKLLWESDLAVAVDKPAGLATQAPAGIDSLESRLQRQFDRRDSYLAFPHRLDRAVSGVILVALTKKAARLLSAQFASRKTRKQYLAVVEGRIEVGRSSPQQWDDFVRKLEDQPRAEVCDESAPHAKPARTIVKTLALDTVADRSLLELSPITGRMHQLRVQTASRGHPIVGDEMYGAAGSATGGAANPHTGRILLHAHGLEFHDPSNGRLVRVESPCPFEFTSA
ncbi:Ribosomal large subunit pseudouridine synthase A [Stieleria maiorica]|uniref:Ribosomal large subunit pseudouridine synthase A n=1 Tax=Stieleria maiorica TaxID=2795974 RepID=A0A5B9M918_9BACT|nr:RluA family pseudouridine synthase [Stieleria maiorica]QEF97163.1 Ribosomal large subunit pseudouridine synthase A [Stieleria maiorica]